MELKPVLTLYSQFRTRLLIVPYGIETWVAVIRQHYPVSFNRTLWNWNSDGLYLRSVCCILLIVPYGIETKENGSNHSGCRQLLIVPYGIETAEMLSTKDLIFAFNRTLWNWNGFKPDMSLEMNRTFNRTLWNWNTAGFANLAQCTNF